jgi:transposase-like protein
MVITCPNTSCINSTLIGFESGSIVRNGFYRRQSDSRLIQRFRCKLCLREFSRATSHPCFGQKKRRINFPLSRLLVSGVSQRRAARILGVNPKTVVRKFHFLGDRANARHQTWLSTIPKNSISEIHFDDLETAEHTKCKPLSVSLAVDPKGRKILNFKVSQMPAKGLLAKRSLKKYGYRKDMRPQSWDQAFSELKEILNSQVTVKSDENPHYPRFLKKHLPEANHIQFKGARGAVSGQGELKKLKFDPLFALNHTCAMLRANINRLFRRTWCISKTKRGLMDHLALYIDYHNRVLTPLSAR